LEAVALHVSSFYLRAQAVYQPHNNNGAGMSRILLVEDDPDVGPLLENILLFAGHKVSKVATVAAAQLLLGHRSHDLVLTDINLPDGNGIAIADKAKDLGAKVVLITGYALQIPADQLRRHEYLMKPVRAAELLAVIERTLQST
jgi:DNA-binding NtrC family response regulator